MSNTTDSTDGGNKGGVLPQVRLVRRDNDTLVAPPGAPDGAGVPQAFEPFPLAKLPKSMTDQLALFGELVWGRYRRCVGVLLLLDPVTRSWGFGVPRQRCGKRAACWSALREGVPELARTGNPLLAGSYQIRVLRPGEDVADAVPPADGVHLVHLVHPDRRSIWSFLRADGQTHAVPAGMVILDDLEFALDVCLPRLGLA